eukprot:snap_masked-scaffold_14-processed-gene-9.22-mRNA-1 protein AED:0.30 eAED:0.32 QI:0/0/0/1/1/1/2/0/420
MKFTHLSIPFLISNVVQSEKITVASCFNVEWLDETKKSPFELMIERDTNALLWSGDLVYADILEFGWEYIIKLFRNRFQSTPSKFRSQEHLEYLFNKTKNQPEYQNLLNEIGFQNHHGTWDDHDFGKNNGGKWFSYKDDSQESFLNFFEIKADDDRRKQQGLYHAQYLFDEKVKVIFLDLRYFRDEYSTNGDFLGEAQWTFVENELNDVSNSTEVTIVVSSLHTETCILQECWVLMKKSRSRLLETIASSSAPGIVLVSGDVHHTEMFEGACSCFGNSFKLPEITASGVTHSSGDSLRGHIVKDTKQRYFRPQWQIPGSFALVRNFGEIEVDFENEILTLRSVHSEGMGPIFEQTYLFDELKPRYTEVHGTECSCIAGFQYELSLGLKLELYFICFMLFWFIWRAFRILFVKRLILFGCK